MKIENLVEKDTVLDDDYLIVNGTDGTKKAKKSTLLSDVNSRMNINGWFAINFSSKKRNGFYVAVLDFPKAYELIDDISVLKCTGYDNYSSVDLECTATMSEYSKNSIIINCDSESALGISANINLSIAYKTDHDLSGPGE